MLYLIGFAPTKESLRASGMMVDFLPIQKSEKIPLIKLKNLL